MRAMLEWGYRVLCQTQLMKYAFIRTNRPLFTVASTCKVLAIKPSSYYDWKNRDISDQQIHRNHCELLVKLKLLTAKLVSATVLIDCMQSWQSKGLILVYTWSEVSLMNMASNAVATSALKSPLIQTITSWSIQTCWIRSLTPVDLMNLGSVILLISGQARAVLSWN